MNLPSIIRDCEEVIGLLNVELSNENIGALSQFRLEYCRESVMRVISILKNSGDK